MGISLKQVKSSINVTYSELYDLVINNRLVPGATYRLTDYRNVNFLHGQRIADYDWTYEIQNGQHDLMPGTKDQTFRVEDFENLDSSIQICAVALQSDGKIIIGGNFYQYQGVVCNNIARLNTDGTIDTSFYTNDGFSDTVLTLAIDRFDRILVGGIFTHDSTGNTSIKYMTRLNKNGDRDEAFPYQSLNNAVRTIKIDINNKIWIGGEFTEFVFDGDTYQVDRIVCLTDGTNGPIIIVQGLFSFDGAVNVIEFDSNAIFIGGEFTTYNGSPALKLIKLNGNLSIDTDFDTSIMFGSSDYVKALTIDHDTNYIYIGGHLTTCNGVSASKIVRTDTDNTNFDTGFNDNLINSINSDVYSLKIQTTADGKKLLVSGPFNTFNGTPIANLIRLNLPNGDLDTNFSSFVYGYGYNITLNGSKILFPDYEKLLRLNSERIQNPYFTPTEIHYGATESLILVARTTSEFETEVSSEQYPQDIIEYNPLVNTIGVPTFDFCDLMWTGGEEPSDQDGVLYKLYTGTFNNSRRLVTRFEGSYYEDSKRTSYDEPNFIYEYVFDKNEATWSELSPFTGLTGSIHFNGNCGISLDTNNGAWNFGNNDLTFEWFQYTTGDYNNVRMPIFDYYGGTIATYIYDGEISILIQGSTRAYSIVGDIINSWHHFAITRYYNSGSDEHTWRIFQDGQKIGEFSYAGGAGPNFSQGGELEIGYGSDYDIGANIYFEGNITNFRVVNLTAVYTEAYTVPTTTLDATPNGTILVLAVDNEQDFLYDTVFTGTATNITNDDTVFLSIISNPYKGVISPVSGVFKTGYTYKSTFDGSSDTTISINMVTGEVTEKIYDGGFYDTNSLTLIVDSNNELLGGTNFNDIKTHQGDTFYDDDFCQITLPTNFNFLGLTYSEFYLSTNGYLTFNGGSDGCCFPNQGYDDLINNPNGCMPAAIGNPGIVISVNGVSGEGEYPYLDLTTSVLGEGGPQFGHSFYINIEFEDYIGGDAYYTLEGVYENIKPGINHVTNNWSYDGYKDKYGILTSRMVVSLDKLILEFPDLSYKNFVDNKYYDNFPHIGSYNNLSDKYGHILRRFDTEKNIDIPFDFRGTKYRRYELDLGKISLGTNYAGLIDYLYEDISPQDGITYKSTGYHKDLFCFDNYPNNSNNTTFRNIKWMDNPGPDSILYNGYLSSGQYENNVFLQVLSDIKINSQFYNNTILGEFTNNSIGDDFHHNIAIDNVRDNIIGKSSRYNILSGLYNNIIGDGFHDNISSSELSNNIIRNYFYYNFVSSNYFRENKIVDNFRNNNIYAYFANNIIENNFEGNDIYGTFEYNRIDQSFSYNRGENSFDAGSSVYTQTTNATASILGYFGFNIIGQNFYSNRIGTNFTNNTIGDEFQYNIIGGTATGNKIGDYSRYNNIGDYLTDNTIGKKFGYDSNEGNNIGSNFNNNKIDGNFYKNEIGDNFQNNDIKVTDFQEWNLSTAYYVYLETNCTIFKDINNDNKLSYVDGTGTFNVTTPDAD